MAPCDGDACEFFPALPAGIGDDDGPTSRRSRRAPQRRSRLKVKDVGLTSNEFDDQVCGSLRHARCERNSTGWLLLSLGATSS
jgi:hypothetical protein